MRGDEWLQIVGGENVSRIVYEIQNAFEMSR